MLWLLAKREPANCKDLNVVVVHYACSSRVSQQWHIKRLGSIGQGSQGPDSIGLEIPETDNFDFRGVAF